MELPDKSRVYSELIVDSLRIKNNIINDFVNGPTLTYTGSYDVFRLVDIDAFTVTVTLPERYDRLIVNGYDAKGGTPNVLLVEINQVSGPAIKREVRNMTVVSPTTVSFTTWDGDTITVTAFKGDDQNVQQHIANITSTITPPSDHGVYSSAMTALMHGTVVLPSTTYMEAANTARSRPGTLVIANVTESSSDLTIAFNNRETGRWQPFKYTDNTYLMLCYGAIAKVNTSEMTFSIINTNRRDYMLSVANQKIFYVPSAGGYYVNASLTSWQVRNAFEDDPIEYTINVPEGNPEGEGVVGIVNNKAYAIMARAAAPVLVADLTNTPDNTITFTATNMLRGAATGLYVGTLGDMLFMYCSTIGWHEQHGLVCINSSTNTLTELGQIDNIYARLTTDDLIYIEYTSFGEYTRHIGTLSATGEFKQGGVIGDNISAFLFVMDNNIYAVVTNMMYDPAELKKLDPVTLELSPTTDIDGWKGFKFNNSLMTGPSTVVVAADIVTANVYTAGLYFMVANADGDIDEISIAQGGTAKAERSCVLHPSCIGTATHTSPLSTSLRSRYRLT